MFNQGCDIIVSEKGASLTECENFANGIIM
jgi:hypothetical protein